MKKQKLFDLLILGGGIAGMTAAIFAARANLKAAIIERQACGGLANWASKIENFPGYISINGIELMEKIRAQVENLGVEIDEAAMIEKVELMDQIKKIDTSENLYIGKAIIVATGRKPIQININTEFDRIHYCSICDGNDYVDKEILVIGGGDSGFDESLYLLSLGVKKIILIEKMTKCSAIEATQAKLRSHPNVEIRTSTIVKNIIKTRDKAQVYLEDLVTGQVKNIYVDGIFVFIGQKPNTEYFQGMLKLDENGYILTGEDMETNIPGVFAAGDVIRKKYRYLTTALADGAIAALSAEKYIRR